MDMKSEAERLKDHPDFELADGIAEDWRKCVTNNSNDGYSFACVRYANRWAAMMESKIADGATVRDIAKDTSHEADTDGITGFMYGAAVSILSRAWKHGEELRRWHNLDTQIGIEGEKANDSGAVLNPAVLVLGE